MSQTYYGSEVLSEDGPVVFAYNPSYLKLSNVLETPVTFTSLSIEYKCGEEGLRPSGTNIAYLPSELPFRTQQEVQPGEIGYWAGDGGVLNSQSVNADSFTLDYTNRGHTWGIQVFAEAPYYDANVEYHLSTIITASKTGSITINSDHVDVVAGEPVAYHGTIKGNETIMHIQLGVYPNVLESGVITFSAFKILDPTTEYFDVDFKVDGQTFDTVLAKAATPLYRTPSDPTKADHVFVGWSTDGTKENMVTLSSWVPTDGAELIAVFEESAHVVSFYVGEEVVATASASEGGTVSAPALTYTECGFGYGVADWYTENTFTNKYDFSSPVTGDVDLYAKLRINPNTFVNWDPWNMNSDVTYSEDGDFILNTTGVGGDAWLKQVNFENIPVGEAGYYYTVTIEYKASHAFNAQIYDVASIDSEKLVVNTTEWQTISLGFAGGTIQASNKFTFELGGVATDKENISLEIHSVTITSEEMVDPVLTAIGGGGRLLQSL